MNAIGNILINIGVFVTGTALGVLSTQRYFKAKYKKIADEDVRSVKDMYKKTTGLDSEVLKYIENDIKAVQALQDDYERIIGEAGYRAESENIEERKEEKDVSKPYVISPDEFDDLLDEDYTIESLTYYADGILTDNMDNIVDDIDEIIGRDSLEHFGEYEEDTVYVRNDEKKCAYEVCLDDARYADLFPAHVQ